MPVYRNLKGRLALQNMEAILATLYRKINLALREDTGLACMPLLILQQRLAQPLQAPPAAHVDDS